MYIADLHIHSRYSRATSKDCTPEHLDLWARRKGIHLVGTGDFTHKAWRDELKEKLEPAEEGFYRLKKEYRIKDKTARTSWEPRFVVTGEISSIYKKYDRTRKVHSLILLPGLEEADRIADKLETIGNIHSDGRPILGLDCHDLLEIVLELCPQAIYVPAHIWTPHFSLFGAFSGFDTIEECFGDLSTEIHALETGLSSDPPMNWRVSALDRFQLISNSDAHSPAKLGREANLLDISLSYEGLYQAVQRGDGLLGTIEFFPEEGKYHYDGHRKCGICLSPVEAEKQQGLCPVCGRKLTTGVSHRIQQLSDRPEGFWRKEAKAYESLVPLPEVIGASIGRSAASVKVAREYDSMLEKLGAEFEILRIIPIEDIKSNAGTLIAEGIKRLRQGKVERTPGFDGEYGKIFLFQSEELESPDGQMSFFEEIGVSETENKKNIDYNKIESNISNNKTRKLEEETEKRDKRNKTGKADSTDNSDETADGNTEERIPDIEEGLIQDRETIRFIENPEQQKAIRSLERTVAVTAGPGTGKTFTLISHILYLVQECQVKPSEITAVTFTNRAAGELRERLQKSAGNKRGWKKLQTGTFHALCLSYLQEKGEIKILIDGVEALEVIREAAEQIGVKRKPERLQNLISLYKTAGENKKPDLNEKEIQVMESYNQSLKENGLWDYDDLLTETYRLLKEEKDAEEKNSSENQESETAEKKKSAKNHKTHNYLLVDEFQDINPIQYELIKLWNRKGKQLFVIGDPDQSIYGFRGSSSECFRQLRNDAGELLEITLSANYRSTPEILETALSVISKNPGLERILLSKCPKGPGVRLVTAKSPREEAAFVAGEIVRQVGGVDMLQAHEAAEGDVREKNRGFGDIAVLYRTHRQAELIEQYLKQEGIPCIIGGRDSFLSEPAVRGTMCFFRYLLNPEDVRSENICKRLLWKNRENPEDFSKMTEQYRLLLQKTKPERLLKQWSEDMELKEEAAIRKLIHMAGLSGNMEEFLNYLLLGVESDLRRHSGQHYTSDAVNLMTIHGAKGLEFPVVLVCGLNKGLLPLETGTGQSDMQEERRLFYVGMTRAKEELVLLTSKEPSCFVKELPDKTIKQEAAAVKKQEESGVQMSLFDWMK